MAYRDDLEALNAQVRTLKAELEAARQARTAAQAAAQAARAAADEAALIARRSGEASTDEGGRRWMIIAISVGVLAVAVAGYLSYKLMDAQSTAELYHGRMVQQEHASRALKAEIQKLQQEIKRGEQQRASLAGDLIMAQRRIRQLTRRPGNPYGQGGNSTSGDPALPLPSGALPTTLSRAQIQAGMRGIKDNVQGCYDRYKVPGLANVQIKIGRNGRVSSAQTKGMFGGTPTGACVQAMARRARFQPFTGAPITITYPFILR